MKQFVVFLLLLLMFILELASQIEQTVKEVAKELK